LILAQRHQFNAFLTNSCIPIAGPKKIEIMIPSNNWRIQINANSPIPFDGITVRFDVDEEHSWGGIRAHFPPIKRFRNRSSRNSIASACD
jgi:hypothetical protein